MYIFIFIYFLLKFSSPLLGCGESVKDYMGGKCRVQVCRYAKGKRLYNMLEPPILHILL